MSIRVLHVVDKLTHSSGVASVIMNLTEHSKFTHDIAAYSEVCDDLEKRAEARGGKVYRVSDVRAGFGAGFKQDISALLRKNKYTVVHGHVLNSAFIYMKEAERQNVPVRIIHAHNEVSADVLIKKLRNDLLQKNLTRYGTRFVAVSEGAARNAFKKGGSRAEIIRNGVDTKKFKYNEKARKAVREELCLKEGVLCVGNTARFAPQKNHAFLLSVARLLPDALFILAGGGALFEKIKRKAPPNVRFLGVRSDAERLYQAFDIFTLPSLFEGFPMSAVEAQCAGLACILSDKITRDVKCLEQTRFLPIDDAELWAKAISDIPVNNRAAGFEKTRAAGFDIHTFAERIDRLYGEGANEGAADAPMAAGAVSFKHNV